MPRKWTNSKGVNVFNEKSIERNLKYIKKELGVFDNDRKTYKPKPKNQNKKGGK